MWLPSSPRWLSSSSSWLWNKRKMNGGGWRRRRHSTPTASNSTFYLQAIAVKRRKKASVTPRTASPTTMTTAKLPESHIWIRTDSSIAALIRNRITTEGDSHFGPRWGNWVVMREMGLKLQWSSCVAIQLRSVPTTKLNYLCAFEHNRNFPYYRFRWITSYIPEVAKFANDPFHGDG